MARPARPKWSPADDGVLRKMYAGGAAVGEVAAALRRTRAAVLNRIVRLGLSALRAWTPEQDDVVREFRPRLVGDREIGRRIGRTAAAVKTRARELGVRAAGRPPRIYTPAVVEQIESLAAGGATAPEVVATLTIPTLAADPVRALRLKCRGVGITLAPWGLKEQRAELAERFGLPTDLPARAVQILLALVERPRTRGELQRLTGTRLGAKCRATGRYLMTDLVTRGLISYLANPARDAGRGAGPGLYFATGRALELLSAAEDANDRR